MGSSAGYDHVHVSRRRISQESLTALEIVSGTDFDLGKDLNESESMFRSKLVALQ